MLYVATHRSFTMPAVEGLLPVQAGAGLRANLPYQRDDEGDNISALNPHFCELTVVYWAWRNSTAPYKGLCHYRRYFRSAAFCGRMLGEPQLRERLQLAGADIVVSEPAFMLQNLSQEMIINHCCQAEQIELLYEAFRHWHPEHIAALRKQLEGNRTSLCNMLYARAEVFDDYCQWLFPVLLDVHRATDYTPLTRYEQRLPGFLAERLLDVFIAVRGLKPLPLSVVNCEESLTQRLEWHRRNLTNRLRFALWG